MVKVKHRFQGVKNIILFNRHLFLIPVIVTAIVCFLLFYLKLNSFILIVLNSILFITLVPSLISILCSYYIYDISALYDLKFINHSKPENILNIIAGFDETSLIIKERFPTAQLTICDFFYSINFNTPSIKRAHDLYPIYDDIIVADFDDFPFDDSTYDTINIFMAAHELREERERMEFFIEIKRVLKSEGKIFVTEHLRNTANFIAFNIGSFHFYSETNWRKVFHQAGLNVMTEYSNTVFIKTFELIKK